MQDIWNVTPVEKSFDLPSRGSWPTGWEPLLCPSHSQFSVVPRGPWGLKSSRSEITGSCKPSDNGSWESYSGILQEENAPLTTELSVQSSSSGFIPPSHLGTTSYSMPVFLVFSSNTKTSQPTRLKALIQIISASTLPPGKPVSTTGKLPLLALEVRKLPLFPAVYIPTSG